MNIAIIGYGQMGKKAEEAALLRGHKITARIDPFQPEADFRRIEKENIDSADVCIEFSNPKSVIENIEKISSLGKNLVVGTTGWYDKLDHIWMLYSDLKAGLIYAPNFSIGMNVFIKIVKYSSMIFNNLPEYDISGLEIHHNKKADSPSGTALTLSKILIENIERKTKPLFEAIERKILPEELHFSSVRCGSFPGTHKIMFDSTADTIELTHSVRNRDGFAFGAVLAAEWIQGKKGIFTIDNLINDLLKSE
jgi:4-hydroxy-tetrahydrodipicolinate reductase